MFFMSLFASSFCWRRFYRFTNFAGRSWCPEVGLRFLDLTSCDRSEVESRIPNPTSGRLDRVTCWCPEVGLGILDSTSERSQKVESRKRKRTSGHQERPAKVVDRKKRRRQNEDANNVLEHIKSMQNSLVFLGFRAQREISDDCNKYECQRDRGYRHFLNSPPQEFDEFPAEK